MNAFADRLFAVLLGWTGMLFNGIWNIFSGDRGGILDFLQRFWLPLILCLLIFGTVADYLVWFVRWRPQDVWRGWFRQKEQRRRIAAAKRYMENLDHSPLDLPEYRSGEDSQEFFLLRNEPVDLGFSPSSPEVMDETVQAEPFAQAEVPVMEQPAYVPVLPWEQARDAFIRDRAVQAEAGRHCVLGQYGMDSAPPPPALPGSLSGTDSYAAPSLPSVRAAEQPAETAGRRRRAETRKKRRQNAFRAVRDALFSGEDEAETLDSLPPPVAQEKAFHEPLYPQNYQYRPNVPKEARHKESSPDGPLA